MVTGAYSHGGSSLFRYLVHYLFARAVWSEVFSLGVPVLLIGAVGLVGSLWFWRRGR